MCREYEDMDISLLIVPWSNTCWQHSVVFHVVYILIPFQPCMLSPLCLKCLFLFQLMIVNTIIKVYVSENFILHVLLVPAEGFTLISL